jgi:hypothetical protein
MTCVNNVFNSRTLIIKISGENVHTQTDGHNVPKGYHVMLYINNYKRECFKLFGLWA